MEKENLYKQIRCIAKDYNLRTKKRRGSLMMELPVGLCTQVLSPIISSSGLKTVQQQLKNMRGFTHTYVTVFLPNSYLMRVHVIRHDLQDPRSSSNVTLSLMVFKLKVPKKKLCATGTTSTTSNGGTCLTFGRTDH